MDFLKLNLDWDAEPNAPYPVVEISGSTVILTFDLNSFIHKDIHPGDKGVLTFTNCFKYRLGEPNDEGYFRGQCRFSKTGVEWGDFYKITDSGWRTNFPDDEVIVNSNLEANSDLDHYLFYFRDEMFECIAEAYTFDVIRAKKHKRLKLFLQRQLFLLINFRRLRH